MRSTVLGAVAAAGVVALGMLGGVEKAEAAYLVTFDLANSFDSGSIHETAYLNGTYQTGYKILDYSYSIDIDYESVPDRRGHISGYFHGKADGYYENYTGMFGDPEFYFYVSQKNFYLYKDSGSGDGFGLLTIPLFNDVPLLENSFTVEEVSGVPLPAAAPLFGAAILGLGGATYARRRIGKPQTA